MRALPRPFTSRGRKLSGKGAEKELKLFPRLCAAAVVVATGQSGAQRRCEREISVARGPDEHRRTLCRFFVPLDGKAKLDAVHGRKFTTLFCSRSATPDNPVMAPRVDPFARAPRLFLNLLGHKTRDRVALARIRFIGAQERATETSLSLSLFLSRSGSPGITLFVQVVARSPRKLYGVGFFRPLA